MPDHTLKSYFMIPLPGITIQDNIYESSNSLVYRGIRDDGVTLVVKTLKQDYPSPQQLTRYRQEYKLPVLFKRKELSRHTASRTINALW